MSNGYHYVNFYNYFMGMRLTYEQEELGQNEDTPRRSLAKQKDQSNQSSASSKQTKSDSFDSDSKFSSRRAYKSQREFTNFFESKLTHKDAAAMFRSLQTSQVFDERLREFVCQVMFYNENYQIGLALTYEFNINDAGHVKLYKHDDDFYLSRYAKAFHVYSTSLKNFLIVLDITYVLHLIWMSIKMILTIRTRIYEFVKLNDYSVSWIEYVDLGIILLSYTTIVLWGMVVGFQKEFRFPIGSEDDFQGYLQLAHETRVFKVCVGLNTMLI